MSISTRQHTIVTSHGSLAVEESSQGDIPVLLIHGNSSCRGVFRHQLQGRLAQNYRLIAFDLPGHGQSSNAPDPTQSYTRPGLADAAVELLEKLGVTEEIVFGWSLGGHIGIEMVPRFSGMRGLMVTGTPRCELSITLAPIELRHACKQGAQFWSRSLLSQRHWLSIAAVL